MEHTEDLAGAGPRMAESTKVRAHRAGSVVWPWVVGGWQTCSALLSARARLPIPLAPLAVHSPPFDLAPLSQLPERGSRLAALRTWLGIGLKQPVRGWLAGVARAAP